MKGTPSGLWTHSGLACVEGQVLGFRDEGS